MKKIVTINGKEHRVRTITAFGRKVEVILAKGTYQFDGSLAIRVYEITKQDGTAFAEPFGNLTVHMGMPMDPAGNAQCVKTWSENEGWALALARKIGRPSGVNFYNGHVVSPVFEFDAEALAEMADINSIRI